MDRILLQSEKINKIKINTNVNSESGLQNDKSNNDNNQITIISQKATSRKTNKDRDGKNHKEKKIENNTKRRIKKLKTRKLQIHQ